MVKMRLARVYKEENPLLFSYQRAGTGKRNLVAALKLITPSSLRLRLVIPRISLPSDHLFSILSGTIHTISPFASSVFKF